MTDTRMAMDISSKHDEPISEKDVLDRWPLLSLEDLRAARKHGRIAWISGKRGSAWYRPTAVQIYISEFKERRCHVREKNALFELGEQWIGAISGSAALYRFWYDERIGRTSRASLGTEDIEEAKLKLATIVLKGGGKKPTPCSLPFSKSISSKGQTSSQAKRRHVPPGAFF